MVSLKNRKRGNPAKAMRVVCPGPYTKNTNDLRLELQKARQAARTWLLAFVWALSLVFALFTVIACMAAHYVYIENGIAFEICGVFFAMLSIFLIICGIRLGCFMLDAKRDDNK